MLTEIPTFVGSTIDEFKTYIVEKIVEPTFNILKEYKFEFIDDNGTKKLNINKGNNSKTVVVTTSSSESAIKHYSYVDPKNTSIEDISFDDGYYSDSNFPGIKINLSTNYLLDLGFTFNVNVVFSKKDSEHSAITPLPFDAYVKEVTSK